MEATGKSGDFDAFLAALTEEYADYTPDRVAAETGLDRDVIEQVGREIGEAGSRFAAHIWRNTASGNKGGGHLCLIDFGIAVSFEEQWARFLEEEEEEEGEGEGEEEKTEREKEGKSKGQGKEEG